MSQVKNGGVEGIYLTENKKVIGYKRFLSLIEGRFRAKQYKYN